ncbi:TPA: hypothetical protein ACGO1T_000161 [Streptococcus suis]
MLGNHSRSTLIIVCFLFFGAVSTAFATTGQSQYAIVSIIIASIIRFFNASYVNAQAPDDVALSFALELESLAKMVTYGLAPASLLIRVTQGHFAGVLIGSFYLLSVATRIAHYNRPLEWQGQTLGETKLGIPLVSVALTLPVLSLLSWILPPYMATFLWILVFLILTIGMVLKIQVPPIHPNFKLAVLALGILAAIALIIQGTIIV